MSDYGLRQHNRRIGTAETVQHSPRYYEVRSNVRMIVRLVLFLGECALAFTGVWAFIYFTMLVFGNAG